MSALERNGISRVLTHAQGVMQIQNGINTGEMTFFVIDENHTSNDEELSGRLGGKYVFVERACHSRNACDLSPSGFLTPCTAQEPSLLFNCADGYSPCRLSWHALPTDFHRPGHS